jgi:hypothetical protein
VGLGTYLHGLWGHGAPPLPFAYPAQSVAYTVTVPARESGLAALPLGGLWGAGTVQPSPSTPGLLRYENVTSLSRAHPHAGWLLDGVHFGLAADGSKATALVLDGSGPASVIPLEPGARPLAPVLTRGPYAVYLLPGVAGAVQVSSDGRRVVLTWSRPVSIVGVTLVNPVWSAATSPLPYSGSATVSAPPAGGKVVGFLPAGVLWRTNQTVWLLPKTGVPLPVLAVSPTVADNPVGLQLEAGNPVSEAVLLTVVTPIQSGTFWWNLATGAVRPAPRAGSWPLIAPIRAGWFNISPPLGVTGYITGRTSLLSNFVFTEVAVSGHEVLGAPLYIRPGGNTNGPLSLYNWTTGRVVPTPVQTVAGQPAVAATSAPNDSANPVLPGWGFTLAEFPGSGLPGNTLTLVSVDGRHRYTETLQPGTTIQAGQTFLVKTVAGSPAIWGGWPNADGRFVWHLLGDGTPSLGRRHLYWMSGGRLHVWGPPAS